MNKKILLGSIIAVVILVLVSFTGVVGYQTTKSSTITRASPLFTIRTSRAIDEESNDIYCDYVGKGKESPIQLPKRKDMNELLQNTIITLSKMKYKEFNQFLTMVLYHLSQENSIKNKNIKEFITSLYQLRNNNDEINNILNDEKEHDITDAFPTKCSGTVCKWDIGCMLENILILILMLLIYLLPTFLC